MIGRVALGLSIWAALVGTASAHQFAPALIELRETPGGNVAALWREPAVRVQGSGLRPVLPAGCRGVADPVVERIGTGMEARWEIQCPGGLGGLSVGAEGILTSGANVLVRVELADGSRHTRVLTADDPSFVIPSDATWLGVARSYTGLGFEHILSGYDHLLFVLGLTLLVGFGRNLAWTITAFTLGHSVTLALAVLGFVEFPSHLIEVGIAASLYFLALELAGVLPRSLLRDHPWAIAGGFGLLHGLGFAGALADVGLPHGDIPLALLTFNVGIELGQLFFVAVVLVGWALARRLPGALRRPLRLAPAYAIGSLAVLWVLERI